MECAIAEMKIQTDKFDVNTKNEQNSKSTMTFQKKCGALSSKRSHTHGHAHSHTLERTHAYMYLT